MLRGSLVAFVLVSDMKGRVRLMFDVREGQITEINHFLGFRGDHRYVSGVDNKVTNVG